MIIAVPVSALAVAGVASAFAFLGGSDPDPDPPGPDLPDGFVLEDGILTTESGGIVSWHVFDQLHSYMESRDRGYAGYDEVSESVALQPGRYTVDALEQQFEVVVPGELPRQASWEWNIGGTSNTVSVSFAIDVGDYLAEHDASKARNSSFSYFYFENLPKGVIISDTVSSIASQLRTEYIRIGGSADDRQGFADFIASFPQVCVDYPPRIPLGDEDYYIWGQDEYWCTPMETLYHMVGDCDDNAALICALYLELGYRTAMGGMTGHAFSGVALDDFQDKTDEELRGTGFTSKSRSQSYAILSSDDSGIKKFGDVLYYSVDSLCTSGYDGKVPHPVGYLRGGNTNISTPDASVKTFYGWAGFYEVDRG